MYMYRDGEGERYYMYYIPTAYMYMYMYTCMYLTQKALLKSTFVRRTKILYLYMYNHVHVYTQFTSNIYMYIVHVYILNSQ